MSENPFLKNTGKKSSPDFPQISLNLWSFQKFFKHIEADIFKFKLFRIVQKGRTYGFFRVQSFLVVQLRQIASF